MFRRSVFAIVLAGLLAGAADAQQTPLVFTAIPDEDETRLVERFTQYAKYFESKLGVPVKYLAVKSYPAAVTAFINNQVQFAWFGGLTGVQARLAVPGSQAIAQGAEDVAFKSYIIAHISTGLKAATEFPKDIEGKTFTFGARASTSGRLFPEHFIRQALGKEPDKVFARVGYSGDHSRTIQLVQSGAYQVGVLNHLVWDQEVKSGKVDTGRVSVIWETPAYPDYHWVARGDMDRTFGGGFTARLQVAILGVDDPKLLAIFDRSKFIPAKNSDYTAIENVGKLTGLIN
ncbi:MAG: putative selenate ABC transporter substrate-binding protein [Hyphomonadaceae bacterium]|jgi:phosphonate transport system substrate-binding protein|nr:putative selenate ABC transporter substrate-binding protein [Hyphomonadaceae bacterium]